MTFGLWLSATIVACGDDEQRADDGDDSGASSTGGSATGGDVSGAAGGASQTGGAGGAASVDCEAGTRPGDPAGAEGQQTLGGVRFNVRTPPGYRPTSASPLLVVYAPAGGDETLTESFTKLTPDAIGRGWVVAYADHISPMGAADVADAAEVPTQVAATWCIDPTRVYLTGHSDGGSMATLVGLFEEFPVAAIAPSAAGANGDFLNGQPCPTQPLPVMVLHSDNDALFPGFGAEAAAYWSTCAGCSSAGAPLPDGCVVHADCMAAAEVQYCETTGPHGQWPSLNASMLDFLERFTLAAMP